MSSNTSKSFLNITRLKEQENYKVWKLKTLAYFKQEGLSKFLDSNNNINNSQDIKILANIKLLVEDGPLVQIQYYTKALEA